MSDNTIDFLRRFRQLFASCPIYLTTFTYNDRMLEFILRTIWPMLGKNICAMRLSAEFFRRLRQFVPSILNDCSSLRIVFCFEGLFPKFPCDDSAIASDGQALTKWLFTPNSNDVPKMFNCWLDMDLTSNVEAFKAVIIIWHFYGLWDSANIFCWSVVQLRETKANGQNGRRKRLAGKFIINGTILTFKFMIRMASRIGFSTKLSVKSDQQNE